MVCNEIKKINNKMKSSAVELLNGSLMPLVLVCQRERSNALGPFQHPQRRFRDSELLYRNMISPPLELELITKGFGNAVTIARLLTGAR